MPSKKLYIFALIALLNSCTPNISQGVPDIGSSPTIIPSSINSNNISVVAPTPVVTANPTPIPEVKNYTLSAEEIKKITDSNIVNSNNKFGLKLYLDIVKEQENKNIFISPISISLLLQMIYSGATNETKDEIAETLQINSISNEELNKLSQLVINKLNKPSPDITLKVANSIWINKIDFKKKFKSEIEEFYSAEATSLDFSSSATLELINKWASDSTNGNIEKVLNSLSNTSLVLMNAVYFKADWTEKFKEQDTQQREFTLSDGTKKQHPMMSDFRSFKYFKNYNIYDKKSEIPIDIRFEAVDIPYGKDGKISLYLFLPDKDSSLEKFYSQLNQDNLSKWFNSFYIDTGYISFPKFINEWDKELKNNLLNLGMKSTFNNMDGLNNISNIEMGLSGIAQHTYIDINEDGAEAAAVSVATAAASSTPTTRFVADRPFFYLIRDNETKSILFMGAVNNPEYDK